MAKAKSKKIDQKSLIGLAVNFCAVFSLIYVVALLLVANIVGDKQAALATAAKPIQSCSCPNTCAAVPASEPDILVPSSDGEGAVAATLTMDDGGYSQNRIEILASGTPAIKIENRGVNEHSFVIDELNINSGPIKPGQAQTIVLENLSGQEQSLVFYSDIAGDSQAIFGGTIVVVK